jgi:pyrroloquinoline quinone biosynthesis protein B
MEANKKVELSDNITIEPILVPHRDEYTETVGYRICGAKKSCLYISDIDKWEYWDVHIEDLISGVDFAFLDATFYNQREIPGRNMCEIPHPFIVESMARFKNLSRSDKSKIFFIHFNHTNPVLQLNSPIREIIREAGFNLASEGLILGL